ncbi:MULTISPECIES: transporter substrate-binding domain-containing protein [Pseudomonas]|jgi:polar amino acid transport system substrate-binding protein|uniref:transporter substrate-binding domain-containing protein n=1 Tax=Pseudomonas TaxID=286 RepID=UPI0004889314|nr:MULTISPECIES: transporter substrate-binding domain-containing protein [Pseudomonas]PRA48196.1 amino acid ABC transporter substrate-binding protein [Pseudomonas sp. MYb115]QXN47962.1 transporter substrate-binding domain-containing protein [Pseudomonas fluorescens]WSO22270.1 transporter substrate-binding domain-containing protein [Pseudomonas fluorescens]
MGNRRLANWMTGVACVLLAGMSAAQAQPIRFAVAAEPYPPYTEKQANGEWKGFEVDLIHKLCTQMKAECEIKEVAWDGIIPSLLAKKIDVIFSSMSVTAEREKQIAFSKAYYDSAIAVVGPKGTTVSKYPDDLKGKVIGVQNSTVSASYLKAYYEKIADVKYYDTQDSANADLIAGRIDLMMADGTAMTEFVKTPDAQNLAFLSTVPYDPIFGKGVGAGLRKDDTELKAQLDQAIETLLASKDYDDLSQRYFGINVKPAF